MFSTLKLLEPVHLSAPLPPPKKIENVQKGSYLSHSDFAKKVREGFKKMAYSLVFYQTRGGGVELKGVKTKLLMKLFYFAELINTPRHTYHVDMLKNNHIFMRILANKPYELGPGL